MSQRPLIPRSRARASTPRQPRLLAVLLLIGHASALVSRSASALLPPPREHPAEAFPADSAPKSGATTRDVADANDASADATPPSADAAPVDADAARDDAIFGADEKSPAIAAPVSAPPEDPLRIGGQLYLSAFSTVWQGTPLDKAAFSAPALLDVYLDARPNDRVRGFALGRLSYDLAAPDRSNGAEPADAASPVANGGGASNASALSLAGATPPAQLDQLWVRFDMARRVFVTAGRQHVRWGTARFWTPTDYLHLRRRNPLTRFDTRPGTAMLKLHVPVESESWNFYAYGVFENPNATPGLGSIGGAVRSELALGSTELGLGAFVQRGRKPKFAADISTGLGDFDVYGELALLNPAAADRVRYTPDAIIPPEPAAPSWSTPEEARALRFMQVVELTYPTYRRRGYQLQAVAGASYSRKYNDNDSASVGLEYFYNQLGYDEPRDYPGLFLRRTTALRDPASFFYLGRHYAALWLAFPAPFSLDLHSFTLTTLANLSDRSFITRFDYSLTLLTHLTFEAFASVRYGTAAGEFRFGIGPLDLDGVTLKVPPALADFGLALRMSI